MKQPTKLVATYASKRDDYVDRIVAHLQRFRMVNLVDYDKIIIVCISDQPKEYGKDMTGTLPKWYVLDHVEYLDNETFAIYASDAINPEGKFAESIERIPHTQREFVVGKTNNKQHSIPLNHLLMILGLIERSIALYDGKSEADLARSHDKEVAELQRFLIDIVRSGDYSSTDIVADAYSKIPKICS